MKLFYVCRRGLASLLLGLAGTAHALSGQTLLAQSDTIRNPAKPFSVNLELIEYRHGKQTNFSELQVYAKADPGSGRFRTLVRFAAPLRDENKLMLKMGNDMWFYDPSNKVSMRISPQQRLLGQAANGDVVTANMAQDYQAELMGEEEVSDGDRQTRRCYRLDLAASAADVTYHRIVFWTDIRNNRPVKGQFFAASGRLLKTVYYRRYQQQLGEQRPTEMVIIDGLSPAWVTVMRYKDYAVRDIPDLWLQRDYMPRFRPQ